MADKKQTLIVSIVRTPQFQRSRDAVLNKLKIPIHAKRFAQALTGGVEGGKITTLPSEHLPYVKHNLHQRNLQQAAYAAAKERVKINPEARTKTQFQSIHDPESGYTYFPGIENDPNYTEVQVPMTAKDLATETYRNFTGRVPDSAHWEGTNTSFYGNTPNELEMNLGHARVKEDDKGGVRIRDTWQVDKKIYEGQTDYKPWVSAAQPDLVEGGWLAARLYDAANALGTLEKIEQDIYVPPEIWQKIKSKELTHMEQVKKHSTHAVTGRTQKRTTEIKQTKDRYNFIQTDE